MRAAAAFAWHVNGPRFVVDSSGQVTEMPLCIIAVVVFGGELPSEEVQERDASRLVGELSRALRTTVYASAW
jgi:hypothetical protein